MAGFFPIRLIRCSLPLLEPPCTPGNVKTRPVSTPSPEQSALDALVKDVGMLQPARTPEKSTTAPAAIAAPVLAVEPVAPDVSPAQPTPAPAAVAPPQAAPAVSSPAPVVTAAGTARTMEDTVSELLRPMLRQWLDQNMPRVIEKALRSELAANAREKPNEAKH